MYRTHATYPENKRIRRTTIESNGRPLTVADVISLWETDPDFCIFFSDDLVQTPMQAFFWEMPPMTLATGDDIFECVQVESTALANLQANSAAFRSYFDGKSESVVRFENLGGDALLVVPCPATPTSDFAHFAKFLRQASTQHRQALWRQVALALHSRLSHQPLWLSTSGLGIPWLHLRLDTRPKYYSYAPYREPPTP